ncbi:MgtC/SapB family protein [Sphingomonas sp. Root710]|uniref:MgtC/SapB family protein n=1 Tax=Sphingomonas sp. Root710 TaxID=1736594 RepID=UPI000AD5AE8D|nr:MgtC/SapB family protein [Sphingomonas sp. Root710]
MYFSWLDVLARLGAASLLSLAIGIERFVRRKPVDFRPFLIVSLASSALIIGLIEASFAIRDPRLSIDPGRVMSGVMTGVGFLGAGALFREKHIVQGAGSAAAFWAAGAIGIVCGLGLLWLGALLAGGILLLFLAGRPFTETYDARMSDEARGDNGH